jgi:hypothetical protein
VYANFPYVACPARRPAPPLWLASVQNVRQFLLSSRRVYRTPARRHWEALAGSCDEVVAVTLSCGLEILNNCLGAGGGGPRVRVFALGPVAREAPRAPCTLIQGTRDRVSKLFFRSSDVELPGVGHLGYLRCRRVYELIDGYVRSRGGPSAPGDA